MKINELFETVKAEGNDAFILWSIFKITSEEFEFQINTSKIYVRSVDFSFDSKTLVSINEHINFYEELINQKQLFNSTFLDTIDYVEFYLLPGLYNLK